MSVIETGMQAFKDVGSVFSAVASGVAGSNASLIEFTKPTQVEPIVVIDSAVIFNENLPDVMQSLLSQFAGYYLQAAALLSNIDKISVLKQLERLNPNRNNALSGIHISKEDYQAKLPSYADKHLSLEDINNNLLPDDTGKSILSKKDDGDGSAISGIGKDSITQLRNAENLSVGKLITVEVTASATTDAKGKQTMQRVEIPVAIRLQATQLDSAQVLHVMSSGNQDYSARERWDGFLSGRLKFWKDLVFCQDILDSHRRALMKDKDGVIAEMSRRNRNNTIASMVTNKPSLATASNMIIMSSSTAAMVENTVKGRLSDFKVRQKIFDQTSLMIIVIMDPNLNRIKFYYRGIQMGNEFSPRDLKGSNKGSGPDIADIMKAYQLGSAPSL